MNRTILHLSVVVCLFGMVGCGDDPPPSGQDSQTQDDQDAGQNDADNGEQQLDDYDPSAEEVGEEQGVDFVVENGSTISFYFQVQTADEPEPAWLTISQDDEELQINPDCMPRLCEEELKPVCPEREASVLEVEPGEVVTWTWDQRHYESDGDCTTPVDTGQTEVDVEICWGMDVDEENDQILDPDCAGDEELNSFDGAEISVTVT